jgi:hypothetical protein
VSASGFGLKQAKTAFLITLADTFFFASFSGAKMVGSQPHPRDGIIWQPAQTG